MQLSPDWLRERSLQLVMERIATQGFEVYCVGGCVRDAVLGEGCADIDLATNARPHDLPKMFGTKPWTGDGDMFVSEDGFSLYPTGVAHGTWTVKHDDHTFEVTSYRRDVDTDGRRAVVKFADTMEEDAQRRDFTINALYMDRWGHVFDPTGTGIEDLRKGLVRFVGSACERVSEDYLRILRFFRFYARFGRGAPEKTSFNACQQGVWGLINKVANERIWDEFKKILKLYSPAEALWQMEAAGLLKAFGFACAGDQLSSVLKSERKYQLEPDWVARYIAVFGAYENFPMSNVERKAIKAAGQAALEIELTRGALAHKYGKSAATSGCLLANRGYSDASVERGSVAIMPLTSKDLLDHGLEPGPDLGKALAAAKQYWYSTDLRATQEGLMIAAMDEVS